MLNPYERLIMLLLISVVNVEEAMCAVRGGADILDIKNPHEGALGANFPRTIQAIRQQTPDRLPVSVAIGDAPNKPGAVSLSALGAAVCGIQYVKVGLYGTKQPQQAVFLLKEVCRAVRGHDDRIKIIAAAYADADRIESLPAKKLPAVSREAGADGCLLDTFIKDGRSLFSHLDDDELRDFVESCNRQGLLCALAGSLGPYDIPRVSEIGPDIIGFRTAACLGDRVQGMISIAQVEALKKMTAANASPLRGPSQAIGTSAQGGCH
jgi:uncharacterized protein (UPF0264 family)